MTFRPMHRPAPRRSASGRSPTARPSTWPSSTPTRTSSRRASCWRRPTRSCTGCARWAPAGRRRRHGAAERVEVFELYLAVPQAGFYLVPINYHLVGPEIAYIVHDCEAKVFVAHERFADAASAAADEIGFPPKDASRSAARSTASALRRAQGRASPPTLPDRPPDRRFMNYTSGTTGRPRACAARLPGVDPETGGGASAACSPCSASSRTTTTCTSSARRCTTPPCSCSRARRSTSGTRSC